jgi:hypothetical protein
MDNSRASMVILKDIYRFGVIHIPTQITIIDQIVNIVNQMQDLPKTVNLF